MTDVYSNRSNARRAAEAMIAKGAAPAAKYGLTALSATDGGGIKIEWQVEAPAAEAVTPKAAPAVTETETVDVAPVGPGRPGAAACAAAKGRQSECYAQQEANPRRDHGLPGGP